jgi:hypothetical protein
VNTGLRFEALALEFDGITLETAHEVARQMDATGLVRVVSATALRQTPGGEAETSWWSHAADVADLEAELAAGQVLGNRPVTEGITRLDLVIEHLWVHSVVAGVLAVGGRCTASALLPPVDDPPWT